MLRNVATLAIDTSINESRPGRAPARRVDIRHAPRPNKLRFALIVFATAFLFGCSSGNVKIKDPNIVAKIKIGETTMDEVRELLGKPSSVSKGTITGPGTDSYEMWSYAHTKIGFIGRTSIASLVVTFDNNGVVNQITTGDY